MTTLRGWALSLVFLTLATSCGRAPLAGPCPACPDGSTCDPNSGTCVPQTLDAGGGCTSDSTCGGATPRCLVAEGRCVGCLGDADCSPGTCDASSATCQPLPDSCASAQTVTLGNKPITLNGSTLHANDDTRLSCALPGTAGGDVVYALDLPRRGRLRAHLVPAGGSALDPVMALRSTCDSEASERALGCTYPASGERDATLVVDDLEPGRYYLWIDGDGGEGGAFTLVLEVQDPSSVDSCVSPGAYTLGQEPLSISGDTTPLVDDASSSCGGRGAPDAVYAITLTQPRRVRFEAVGGDTFQPLIYLRSTCADASQSTQVACAIGSATGTSVIDVTGLAAGTWYLFVDGPDVGTRSGRYRLTITPLDPSAPPPNDTCLTAMPLPVPVTELGRITVTGTTANGKDDALGCGGTGPDVAYTLSLAQARAATIKVSPAWGSTVRPVLFVRRPNKCASELVVDTVACTVSTANGSPAALVVPRLDPGVWTIWVDGVGALGGPFELSVELAMPPPVPSNDTCSAPAPLALTSAPLTVQGTTLGATDDLATCGLGLAPDVAYRLIAPSRASVALDVRAAGGSPLHPIVGVYADPVCADSLTATQAECGFGDPLYPDRAVLVIPEVQPGAYPTWIDGMPGTQGAFTVRASMGAVVAVPANDTCGVLNVPELISAQSLGGDTRAAANDVAAPACGFPTGGNGELAPDVAYFITITVARTVTITVTPDPTDGQLFRPVVSVRGPTAGSCSTLASVKGCAAAQDYGKPVALSLPNLAAGTYTVWVDGAGASSGRFAIALQ